jgi:predicted CxxxxCH...CXXCH cytochrome family protein
MAAVAMSCGQCHAGAVAGSSGGANHINGSVTVAYGYPVTAKHAAGSYTGTCSTAVCHGQGAPRWGASSTTPVNGFPYSSSQCGKCHSGNQVGDVTALKPFYSTEIPVNSSAANAKVGAHTAHLTAANALAAALVCNDCHSSVSSLNAINHMNGTTDFVFSTLAKTGGLNPTYSNGQCANTYCHGATLTGGGSTKNPNWTQTLSGCDTCHGFPPAGTHPNSTTCNSCHTHVNSTNNGFTVSGRILHINGHIDVDAGSCDACHGYPPAPRNPAVAFGTANTWPSARFEDYSGGGGAHLVAAHIPKNANPADAWVNCAVCHNSGIVGSTPNHKMTLPISKNVSNVTVAVDPQYRFANSQTIYSSSKLRNPPAKNITGNCSNISCHMRPSPNWSIER